jgi:integration host factor subunit beta
VGNDPPPRGGNLGIAMSTDRNPVTITKKDLVDRIAEDTGNKRVVVKKIVQRLLEEIISELGRGNRLEFRDFGVFEIRERAARVAQNPKTMEKVRVPSKRTVKFKVGRLMKERLTDERPHTGQPFAGPLSMPSTAESS